MNNGGPMQKEKSYVVKKYEEGEVHIQDGVYGWFFPETGEHRPFDEEQMQSLIDAGYATHDNAVYTRVAREKADEEFFRRYREQRANQSVEERAEYLAELRSEYGEGETIVDVITGEKFYT
jgi:hypothetical protein